MANNVPGQPVPRDERGRILPGYSLNPKGRKSLAAELPFIEGLKKGASAETVSKIMEGLGKIATDPKASIAQRLQASALYLQYTVPTPPKTVVTQTGELGAIDDDTARQIVQDAAEFLSKGDAESK